MYNIVTFRTVCLNKTSSERRRVAGCSTEIMNGMTTHKAMPGFTQWLLWEKRVTLLLIDCHNLNLGSNEVLCLKIQLLFFFSGGGGYQFRGNLR